MTADELQMFYTGTLLTGKVVKILELVVKQFQQLGTSTDTLVFIDPYSSPTPLAITLISI